MGSGHGVIKYPHIMVGGVTTGSLDDFDPFESSNYFFHGDETVAVWDMLRLMYRLKVLPRKLAYEMCDRVEELASLSIGYKKRQKREAKKYQKMLREQNKPTYDRSLQYKPSMKGKGYSRR